VVQVWWIVGLCAALAGVCGLWLWSWHRWRGRLAAERAERAVQAFAADVERLEASRALVWVAGFARDALAGHESALEAEREGVDWLLWDAEMENPGESE
jgi:hypothetical protein